MNFFEKIITGNVPGTAPSTSVQICYLKYNAKEKYCCPRLTKCYNLNMVEIERLLHGAKNLGITVNKSINSLEHEIWQQSILKRVLGNSLPFTTNNTNELKVYEWQLQSSVAEAFIFNKIQFNMVTVIIENGMQHWCGIRTASNPVYVYQRSRPRPRNLLSVECEGVPPSPIILAAADRNYKSKCETCGKCNQIIKPMEKYIFERTCANIDNLEPEVADVCTEIYGAKKPKKFSLKKLFEKNQVHTRG